MVEGGAELFGLETWLGVDFITAGWAPSDLDGTAGLIA